MNPQEIFGLQQPPHDLRHLCDLHNAVKNVSKKHYEWSYSKMKRAQKIERVFAYELYHQFRILTTSTEEYKALYSGLRFDGEINKLLINGAVDLLDTQGADIEAQEKFTPDLVLHFGQNFNQQVNQKVIVEIKTKEVSPADFKKTIIKLNHYLNVLNFQYAVFISVNTDSDVFKQNAYGYFRNVAATKRGKFQQLILLNYKEVDLDNKDNNVDCISLQHLLNTWVPKAVLKKK